MVTGIMISNICGRDTVYEPVTIAEIKRIARPGCGMTHGGAGTDQLEVLRAASGLAKKIDEGLDATGRQVIVFEFN